MLVDKKETLAEKLMLIIVQSLSPFYIKLLSVSYKYMQRDSKMIEELRHFINADWVTIIKPKKI